MRYRGAAYNTRARAYRIERTKAFSAGAQARKDGRPEDANPYPSFEGKPFSMKYDHGVALHKAWRGGWRNQDELGTNEAGQAGDS